jgi:hypothetical protein
MGSLILVFLVGFALLFLAPVILSFYTFVTFLIIYIIRAVYPIGLGIAKWVTARRNCLPFFLFMLIAIAVIVILLIGSYYFAANVHWLGFLALVLLLMLLAIVIIIFGGGLTLAIIMWIVRLSHWAFDGFRRAMHGKPAPEFATVGVRPSYRVRRRVEGLYPPVPSAEGKARRKAEARAVAKAQEKAKAIAKARAKALAKAQAVEKARAKELAKAQAIAKARAKALAEAQALTKAKKTKPEETAKPRETTKPRRRRRLRPRPRPGGKSTK